MNDNNIIWPTRSLSDIEKIWADDKYPSNILRTFLFRYALQVCQQQITSLNISLIAKGFGINQYCISRVWHVRYRYANFDGNCVHWPETDKTFRRCCYTCMDVTDTDVPILDFFVRGY